MIGRLFSVAAMWAAIALPAGAQAKDKDRERSRDRDERQSAARIDTLLPLSRNGSIEVQLHSGDVIITGWSRNEVRIIGESARGELRIDATSSQIEVGGRMVRGRMGDTRLEMSVPHGTRLDIATHSGDVTVRGVRGELDLTTNNGDVVIEDVTTRLDFETVSGDLQVLRVEGIVRGETMSGDITLHSATGDVDLETVSGDIVLRDIRSKSIRAETVSGSVEYEGQTENDGRYDFASHSGDVRLILPSALGALIAVETYSGTIDSDFEIVLQPGQRHGKTFEFQVGKGGARIDASSFSGGIYLQRGSSRDRE
jgi:DUF4097 and DUF4098 domain-containing protein YvlB